MRIIGFYHIYMINHWMEIVQEQVELIRSSGLYDSADRIFIGCIGSYENKVQLERYLQPYYKFCVASYSENSTEYEFITLRMLQLQTGAEPFLGFYLHTKGVSYPKINELAFIGGNYWRQYMNYHVIKCWRKCVDLLNAGNDLCGVKLLTERDGPAKQLHYSGNFFWCQSEHVKKLPHLNSQNMSNRYDAEFWIGKNHPIAATLCQEFVDYNTQKNWVDPS